MIQQSIHRMSVGVKDRDVEGLAIYENARVVKVMHSTYTRYSNVVNMPRTKDADDSGGRQDVIHNIYVFCGNDAIYKKAPTESDEAYFEFIKRTGFFSESELAVLANLPSKRTTIILVADRINMDDTIYEIKCKILRNITKTRLQPDADYPLTSATMYLFARFTKDLTTQSLYNHLSHNGHTAITNAVFINYLSNIDGAKIEFDDGDDGDDGNIGKNHIYSYNDIKKIKIVNNSNSNAESLFLNGEMTCSVITALGHSFRDADKDYLFSANPFINSPFIPGISDKTFKDGSGQMLMSYGLPLYNTLYMCSYSDVCDIIEELYEEEQEQEQKQDQKQQQQQQQGSDENEGDDDEDHEDKIRVMKHNAIVKMKQVYFPFLKSIERAAVSSSADDFVQLTDRLKELYATETDMNSPKGIATKHVNFLYNVYDSRIKTISNLNGASSRFTYLSTGVSYLSMMFKPITMERKFPVDAIFRTICSSEAIPFIKMRYSGKVGDSVFKLHAPHVNKYGNRVPMITMGDFNKINRMCKSRQRIDCISLYFGEAASAVNSAVSYVVIEIDSFANIGVEIKTNERESCSVDEINRVISRLLNPVLGQINGLFEQGGSFIPNFETIYDTDHVKIINMRYEFKIKHSKRVDFKLISKCGSSVLFPEPGQQNIPTDGGKTSTSVYDFKRVSDYNRIEVGNTVKTNGLKLIFQMGNLNKDGPYTLIIVSGITCVHMLSTVPIYVDSFMRVFHEEMTNISRETIQEMCFTEGASSAPLNPTGEGTSSAPLNPTANMGVWGDLPPTGEAAAAAIAAAAAARISLPNESPELETNAVKLSDDSSDDEFDFSGGKRTSSTRSRSRSSGRGGSGRGTGRGTGRGRGRGRGRGLSRGSDRRSSSSSESGDDAEATSAAATTAAVTALEPGRDDEFGMVPKSLLSILKNTDPDLFDAEPGAGTKLYASCCTRRSKSNINKNQPIALTDKEMEAYEKTSGILTRDSARQWPHVMKDGQIDWDKTSFWRYSGELNGKPVVYAIRFGSTRNKMRWYICPRYWNSAKGSVINDADVERLKTENSGKLPTYIEEFSVDGVYTPLFPGLVEEKDGRKMPCCFSQMLNSIRVSGEEMKKIKQQKRDAEEKHEALLQKYKEEKKRAKDAKDAAANDKTKLAPPPQLDFPTYGKGIIPNWQNEILVTGIIPPLDELNRKIKEEEHSKSVSRLQKPFSSSSSSSGYLAAAAADSEAVEVADVGRDGDRILKADSRLKQMQLGHLPIALQRFFNTTDRCEITMGCLLRRGVEHSVTQSFLGAIACIYNPNARKPPPSIADMRKLIADSISLDTFVSYNNGSLVTQFVSESDMAIVNADNDEIREWLTANIPDEIKASAIYEKLISDDDMDEDEDAAGKKEFLYRICASLLRFKELILRESTVLDHSLLWEIVTSPNPNIFKRGINMFILDIPNNDDTHSVNVLCPPNRYAEQIFDHAKSVAFIVKRTIGGVSFYEPICLYGQQKTTGDNTVQFLFNLHTSVQNSPHPVMFENIKHVIEYIRNLQTVYCPPVISRMNFIPGSVTRTQDMDMGHKFRSNVHAKRVERMLLQTGFIIWAQVLNYDNRVVGLIASYADENRPNLSIAGYVPTESSEIIISDDSDKQVKQYGVGYGPRYPLKYVDDSTISWLSHQLTLSFLKFVHARTGLPCQPVVNVTDDADDPLIIGVLTETNQFVRISSPEPVQRLPNGDIMDIGMPTATANAIGVKDHHTVDMAVLLDRGYNTSSRSKFIRMIELETNFYNAFRITARHLLNSPSEFTTSFDSEPDVDPRTETISKEIYDIVYSENDNPSDSSGYENKLSSVTALLRTLMRNSIDFVDYDTSALSRIETCIAPGSCDGTRSYCARDDARENSATSCRLRIPARRLMFHREEGGDSNPTRTLMEPLFYSRLADELIRFPRMRDFMFTERPNDYYIASRIPRVVCEDELLLTQSMIDGTDSQNGFFVNEANQPDVGQAKQVMNINTSVFNVKRKRVVETHRRNAVTEAQMKARVQTRQEVVKMSVPKSVLGCLEPKRVPYTMEVFQGVFPGDILDAKIVKNGDITLALFINLLHVYNKLNPKENVAPVKQKLIETYDDIFRTYSTVTPMKVCNLWMKSGIQMNRLARDVISGLLTIENAIRSSVYTLTPLDLWILSSAYELPVILYSASHEGGGNASDLSARFFCNGCPGSGSGSRARILYSATESNSESYCVIVSLHSMNSFPVYGTIQYGDGEDKEGFSIRKDDIKFGEPVAALYNKNERIADFIDKWNEPTTVKPAAVIDTSVKPSPMNLGLELAKSLPLVQMKKNMAQPRIEEEDEEAEQDERTRLSIQEWGKEEVHNPQVRTLLQTGKAKLNVALERLDSPSIDPVARQESHAIQEKVDNLRI